ncbi:hypothetical protein CAEBREN_01971 [Caenorhabditis brenneri]|uniref:Uncharacterized protein n=1 Tax=Caenorhabditis brenneri TaxID=135651 RepID=G0M8I3_CAEBE|nr:hypothetical protein CAEBREN_01971 [Caenorhabditis brenneri]
MATYIMQAIRRMGCSPKVPDVIVTPAPEDPNKSEGIATVQPKKTGKLAEPVRTQNPYNFGYPDY